ncbi:family 20 glycosylhydrolase [Enterovibrio nigricans]|uniref:beta-N-acetylhexosaminidase n=1 Tax=Enterovibrio nigricans DSM 22720 TaxID=1121868 RepID=A0A1T4TUG2_9GAMM|nr:family 20 glycosylhydrolase [Enterovibrio nigricans]PKF51949.1 beta-N-acetylglucosaminidase [Enterovibrio nigricans]SKA43941.1 hexosaminidase [Enterovibrio nigricans DSM 22720]
MLKRVLLATAISGALASPSYAISSQALSQLGDGIDLTYAVLDNQQNEWRTFKGEITLQNGSSTALPATGWAIYFSHIRMMQPLTNSGLTVTHVNGDIFKIEPTDSFKSLEPGQTLTIEFESEFWQIAKTDIMPNWYLVSDSGETALIASTSNNIDGNVPTKAGEELPFVADFDSELKWKRYGGSITDFYDPFTAADRYARNSDLSELANAKGVIPTPASIVLGDSDIAIDSSWVVVFDNGYQSQAEFLANQFGLTAVPWTPNQSKVIHVGWGQVSIDGQPKWEEAYSLTVSPSAERIDIDAVDPAGALYAAQSLLQLTDGNIIPEVNISDAPRFAYRGLSIDAARNFRTKDSILELLDQMAAVKLNKLHLRLSDDEAWRIEIPALPELADIGSQRCHDLSETTCVLPFLGAGPDGTAESNGYYTQADYKEILEAANALNIEVIPEVDMPGHAHAAIKAMEARYEKLAAQGDMVEANEYLLSDPDDTTEYLSVQMFTDNAMNVCMDSTYNFVDTVVGSLVQLHQDIQPLKTFHFGGDEIAGAWTDSPICQAFLANNSAGITTVDELSQYFVERISVITANHNLDLGGWEDGLMHNNVVYPRGEVANTKVSGNAWQNIWEWGVADRAYNLANNGYGVIYNQATHFYFDHPYEPDPEERGYYWAPRFTDTRKSFGFMPDDLYANADFTRAGAPITKEEVLNAAGVKTLERPENVLGLQGSVWTETIRTEAQFEGMTFPRAIALAERAWHTAPWEAHDADGKLVDDAARTADYNTFANLVAQNVMPNLEANGIAFNLPVPGGIIESGVLKANSAFPGLAIEYSVDNGQSWLIYNAEQAPSVSNALIRTVSGDRSSRVAEVK